MSPRPASPRFVAALGLVLAAVVVRSGIGCHYPDDWWLENVMVAVGLVVLALAYRAAPLSRTSYVLVLVFLALHEVGAHWTFAEVPYDRWWRALFGRTLNETLGLERNHYDRLVHFTYGLLVVVPLQEALDRWLRLGGFASAFTAWVFLFASASLYELIEWAAALVFGGELGMAYLGTQGDVLDSHKDTGLAVIGALVTLLGRAAWRRSRGGAP